MLLRRYPGDWFPFANFDIDLTGQFSDDLDFIYLRQLLQPVMHARQVYAKNVFAFAHGGRFQDLFSLQRSVCPRVDCCELVIRIFEKETSRCDLTTGIDARDQGN